MPEGEPNSDGAGSTGESGAVHSGMTKAEYDKWYGVGQAIEKHKDSQADK